MKEVERQLKVLDVLRKLLDHQVVSITCNELGSYWLEEVDSTFGVQLTRPR